MPTQRARVNYANFVKGKISDFNPLYPPESVARELTNVDVDLSGKVGRRLGLEPETDFNLPVDVNNEDPDTWLDGLPLSTIKGYGIDTYKWTNVDDVSGKTFRVLRIGHTVYIYDEGGDVLSDSLVRVIDISSFAVLSEELAAQGSFSGTSGKGLFICAGSGYTPFYLKYSVDTDIWSTVVIQIRVRDFIGVDDGLGVTERPSSLTPNHLYNLYNQGWPSTTPPEYNTAPLRHLDYFDKYNEWPSNAEIAYFGNGLDENGFFSWRAFNVKLNSGYIGTRAPQGHFVIDPFDGYSRYAGITVGSLTGLTTTPSRPKAVAFFAGRVWYGSVNGEVFYSKILESEDDLGICYQRQDPTAEDVNELLDTDGGTLKVLDIGECEAMTTLGDSLILLGTGGIWAINGGDTGFTANNQLLINISKVGVTNYRSVVATGAQVYFWSEEGIFLINADLTIKSLSVGRIQRDYNRIPGTAKAFAQGAFDSADGKIYWAYSQHTTSSASDFKNKYTNLLVYSIRLDAFWDYSLSNEGYTDEDTDYPVLCNVFSPSFYRSGSTDLNVIVTGGIIVLGGVEESSFIVSLPYVGQLADLPINNLNGCHRTLIRVGNRLVSSIHRPKTNSGAFGTVVPSIIISDDYGDTWTIADADYSSGASTRGGPVIYSPELGRVVTYDNNGFAYSDDEGTTWTYEALSVNHNSVDIDISPICGAWSAERGEFVVGGTGADSGNHFAVSTNGTSWVAQSFVRNRNWYMTDMLWVAAGHNKYVVCGRNTGDSAGLNTLLWYSSDAITWNEVNLSNSWENLYNTSLAYSPELDRVVVLGSHGHTAYSDDGGVTWTESLSSISSAAWLDAIWSTALGLFVVVSTNSIASSPDGITWTVETSLPTSSSALIEIPVAIHNIVADIGEGEMNVTVPSSFGQFGGNETIKGTLLLPDAEGNYRPTFGQFSSRSFHDWASLTTSDLVANDNYVTGFPVAARDSGNYRSAVEALPQTLGEPSLKKQATYLYTYYDYVRGGATDVEIADEFDTEE